MYIAEFYRTLKESWFPGNSPQADRCREDRDLLCLALMHERLYASRDLTRIDFSDHLNHLIGHVWGPLISKRRDIGIRIEADRVLMEIDTAVLCGSLIHELVLNALHHAFPDGRAGEIKIELGMDDRANYRLIVSDTGIGLFSGGEPAPSGTTEMGLITMLVEQLGGTMHIEGDNGTKYNIIFTGPRS